MLPQTTQEELDKIISEIKQNFDKIIEERKSKLTEEDKRNFKETIEHIIYDNTKELNWQIKGITNHINESFSTYLEMTK